jgi:hypothetical protein
MHTSLTDGLKFKNATACPLWLSSWVKTAMLLATVTSMFRTNFPSMTTVTFSPWHSNTESLRYSAAGKYKVSLGVITKISPLWFDIFSLVILSLGRALAYKTNNRFTPIPIRIPYSRLMNKQQRKVVKNGTKSSSRTEDVPSRYFHFWVFAYFWTSKAPRKRQNRISRTSRR